MPLYTTDTQTRGDGAFTQVIRFGSLKQLGKACAARWMADGSGRLKDVSVFDGEGCTVTIHLNGGFPLTDESILFIIRRILMVNRAIGVRERTRILSMLLTDYESLSWQGPTWGSKNEVHKTILDFLKGSRYTGKIDLAGRYLIEHKQGKTVTRYVVTHFPIITFIKLDDLPVQVIHAPKEHATVKE